MKVRLRSNKFVLGFILGVSVSAVVSLGISAIGKVTSVLSGSNSYQRASQAMSIIRQIGPSYFHSCGWKIDELRDSLQAARANADQGRSGDRVARSVASLALHPCDCDEDLLRLLDSDEELPAFSFYPQFAGVAGVADHFDDYLEQERMLAVWLLQMEHPEYQTPAVDAIKYKAYGEREYAEMLSSLWKQLLRRR